MSWFSVGFQEAEKMQTQTQRKSRKNFWTKPGESAVIRFMTPAKDSFNYKRAYVPWAKGQKYYTSPGVAPDPFTQAGMQLQSTFAWKVIDRRVIEFEVQEEGQTVTKNIGPRLLYFADGQRTRKSLIAFENQIREDINEERKEEGLPPLSEEEFNLTHFDVKAVKEKGAPWQFFAVRGGKAKPLSADDLKLADEHDFDLKEELRPLSVAEITTLINLQAPTEDKSTGESYSYGEEEDEEPVFFKD